MKKAGQVVVFRFPQTDLEEGKLRPALLLGKQSGLKVTSVIRVGRLAVVSGEILLGAIGEISNERLNRVKKNLSKWLSEK